jgi:hypothetical protein
MLAGARHGDVEQACLFFGVTALRLLHQRAVGERVARSGTAEALEAQPDAAVVPHPHGLAPGGGRLAPEVRDAHDRELQALRPVDRHHAHRVERLALDRRFALALVAGGVGAADERADEVGEAAQVAPVLRLVLACEPHQLANVGHPPRAALHPQQRLVVAGARKRAVDQVLEAATGRVAALLRQPPAQPLDARAVLGGEPVEQRRAVGEGPPRVALRCARRGGELHERVAGEAGERRGEQRVERDAVARVGEHRQVGDEVADLLLGPVAAPADHVRRHAALYERALVDREVAGRTQQQHDVAGRPAVVDQLAHARREQAGLGESPQRRGRDGAGWDECCVGPVCCAIGDEQLDAGARFAVAGGSCRR